MSVRALLSKLSEALAPLTKATPTDTVAVLTDAYEKLGAILAKVQEANGVLPEGMGAEMSTIAGALLEIAPNVSPDPTAGAAGSAPAPGTPAATVPLTLAQKAKAATLTKVELDAYTFRVTTLSAARDRMWRVTSAFEQGKDADGLTELKGIMSMLNNVVQNADAASITAAAPAEKRTVELTPTQFAAWTVGEVQKVAALSKADARPRLLHLKEQIELAKSYFFETEGAGAAKFEMVTAYAPEGGPKFDLTSNADQKVITGNLLANNGQGTQQMNLGAGGAAGGSGVTVDLAALTANHGGPVSMFTKAALEKLNAAVTGLVAEAQPADEPTELEKNDASFIWPTDLAADIKEQTALDKARAEKTNVAKRDADKHWGKDPWAAG